MIDLNKSAFIRPLMLPPSAWHGHIPFAGWITEALRPALFVELGTHYGASYLSFCQTVQTLGLATKCYAVDTWQGDEHAAFYGTSVYSGLSEYHDGIYEDFSKLLRCTFDEAVDKFADKSIDLLHIDGLHTYEAVRHDFESWKPKLSDRAVVLFHDTQERQGDFGVWRLWAELATQYPSFEFGHSHGLGVLMVGKQVPEPILRLGTLEESQRNLVAHLFAALGHAIVLAYGRDWWRSEVQALGGKVANLEGELTHARAQLEHTEAQANDGRERVAQLAGELVTAKDELARTGEEHSAALQAAAEQLHGSQAMRAAVAKVEVDLASAKSEREAALLTVEQISLDLDKEREHAAALHAQLEESASVLLALKAEVDQEREMHDGTRANLESERAAHHRALAAHEAGAAVRAQEHDQGMQDLGMRKQRLHSDIKDRDELIASLARDLHQAQQRSDTIGAKAGRVFERFYQRWNAKGGLKARALNWGIRKVEARHAREMGRQHPSTLGLPLATPQGGFCPPQRADCQDLADYIAKVEPSPDALQQQTASDRFGYRPLVSMIIPIYKVPRDVLKETLRSVEVQTYGNWETCLAWADLDDPEGWQWLKERCAGEPRHKVIQLDANGGISANSNAALAHAEGEFVALLDHDDTITPWALFDMVNAMQEDGAEVDFLYSDKDSISADGACRMNALFKPEWSPEMLHSVNYLTHLNLMRTSVVREVGAWDKETDGAQDWDIFFRVTSASRKIRRVASIHYHWRILPTSTATGLQTKPYAIMGQLRTQKNYFEKRGLPAQVKRTDQGLFHITWPMSADDSEAIVVQRGTAQQLVHALNLLLVSDLSSLKRIHVVHTGDATPEMQAFADLPDSRFTLFRQDRLCWAELADRLDARSASVVVIDGRATGLSGGLVNELLGWVCHHPEISWTTALAVNPEGRVLEAGRVVGRTGGSAPLFHGAHPHEYGWFGGAQWYRNVSAASPFAIAFKMTKFQTASRSLGEQGDADKAFTLLCTLCVESGNGRGLVNPFAVVYLPADAQPAWNNEGDEYRQDAYFNPAFRQVSPLRLMK